MANKVLGRRNFLKTGVALFGTLCGLGLEKGKIKLGALKAFAEDTLHDAKIKMQGYIHEVVKSGPTDKKSIKKYTKHVKSLGKVIKGTKGESTMFPQCQNCKHFKDKKRVASPEGYKTCNMVGGTGKPGKFVYVKGWCRVWSVNKKEAKALAGKA